MSTTKAIFAIGTILLFFGISISPVMAQLPSKLEYSGLQDTLRSALKSDDQKAVLEQILPTLMEKMQTATTPEELLTTLRSFMRDWGQYPLVTLLVGFMIKIITWNVQFSKVLPVRKSALILSWGFAHGLLPSRDGRMNIFRPFTMWYYSGKANLLNSRTMIIDFSPFSIRKLTGRQIGFMQDFIGVYVYRAHTLTDRSFTFMLGHVGTVRGFDLSPFDAI